MSNGGHLVRWIQIATGVVVIGGALWSILRVFNPLKEVDLTVHIRDEIAVNLPPSTRNLPFELKYGGKEIASATIMDVRVENTGATAIDSGEKDKVWNLDLRSVDGARVDLIEPIVSNPPNGKVKSVPQKSLDRVTLQLGLLNPSDTVDVKLILIDPPESSGIPISGETRVPRLHQPVVTRLPLHDRVTNAYRTPVKVLLPVILGLLIVIGIMTAYKWKFVVQAVLEIAVMLSLAVIASQMAGLDPRLGSYSPS